MDISNTEEYRTVLIICKHAEVRWPLKHKLFLKRMRSLYSYRLLIQVAT